MYNNQTPSEHDNSCISNLTTELKTSKNANEAEQQSAAGTTDTEGGGGGRQQVTVSTAPNQEQEQEQVQGQGQQGLRCAVKDAADLSIPEEASRKLDTGDHNHDKDTENGDDEADLDVISSLIGQFGRWQLLMTILLSLFQVPNTFHISSSVYQVSTNTQTLRHSDTFLPFPSVLL